ncbi:O-antigen ligase family protein [Patescibacteria group bacterium]|nr:O-antigen ligase family protein [Patescibacteria group bacterium]
MAKPKNNLLSKLIEVLFLVLILFTPLILTPWNYELFEFNKMIFVYLMTTLIAAAWIGKMVQNRKVIFQPTFWDLPLIAFLTVQAAGTVFSLHPHTSFWGYYTRGHGGLASTICYLVLYWALVSNSTRRQAKGYLKLLLLSGILVAGYGVLERLGIDKKYWLPDVQNRVFSTLGQPNWLAAWLGMIIFLPLSYLPRHRWKKVTPYHLVYLLFLLCLFFTKSRSGLLALGLTWPIYWLLTENLLAKQKKKRSKDLRQALSFTIPTLVLLLVIKNPYRDSLITRFTQQPSPQLPPGIHISESSNIREVVWKGAAEIFKSAPLAGTGTETFAYSYYQHRPLEHNLLSEWDFLYNKAHNEYLNILANNGLMGLITYLGLIVAFVIWFFKNYRGRHQQTNLIIALGVGFLNLLITNFFGFSVVPTGLIFFLFPALSFSLTKTKKEKVLVKPVKPIIAALLVAVTLGVIFRLGQIWYADVSLANSEDDLQSGLTYLAQQNIQTAIRLRPKEPLFHDRYSLISATIALQAQQQDKTSLAQELSQLAILESQIALTLNPYHLNTWKNQARVYLTLAQIDSRWLLKAAETLQGATVLAPTDAKISYNLSLIYNQLNQRQLAIETLEKTVQLKPNYKEARLALGYFYHLQKQDDLAVAQLEYILTQIDPTDESLVKKIEEWQS